jgi:hypothetical protein
VSPRLVPPENFRLPSTGLRLCDSKARIGFVERPHNFFGRGLLCVELELCFAGVVIHFRCCHALQLEQPFSTIAARISRIVIAVVLGEAVWGCLVSITNNLALPAMARVMGGDSQSPLYLGKGDVNVQALFISVLELCFAGIVAVLLDSWSQRPRRVRPKAVRRTPVQTPPAPVVAPPAASPPNPAADIAIQAKAPGPTMLSNPQLAPPSPEMAQSAKPKPPKAVYYKIVGEAVDPDDE